MVNFHEAVLMESGNQVLQYNNTNVYIISKHYEQLINHAAQEQNIISTIFHI